MSYSSGVHVRLIVISSLRLLAFATTMSGLEDGNPFGYLSQSALTSQDNALFESDVDVNWLHSASTVALNGPALRPPAVSFQIPQFLQHGPPMLAHGGGAEVLPAAVFKNQSPTPNWSNWTL